VFCKRQMLLFMCPLRIPSEVRETDVAFLIPIISQTIPLLPSTALRFPDLQPEEIFDDKQ
jgi:hypothetical protein